MFPPRSHPGHSPFLLPGLSEGTAQALELRRLLVHHCKRGGRRFGRWSRSHGWQPGCTEPRSWRSVAAAASTFTVFLGPDPADRLTVIRERLDSGYRYPTSAADVLHVLRHVRPGLRRGVRLLLLHQPSRHEKGRARCYAWTGWGGYFPGESGRILSLNASPSGPEAIWRYSKRLSPAELWDLRYFKSIGASIEDQGTDHSVWFTPRTYRDWMLYHVLLHELGHVNQPWSFRGDAEADAERFALDLARELRERRVIPFEPLTDDVRPERRRHHFSERFRKRDAKAAQSWNEAEE